MVSSVTVNPFCSRQTVSCWGRAGSHIRGPLGLSQPPLSTDSLSVFPTRPPCLTFESHSPSLTHSHPQLPKCAMPGFCSHCALRLQCCASPSPPVHMDSSPKTHHLRSCLLHEAFYDYQLLSHPRLSAVLLLAPNGLHCKCISPPDSAHTEDGRRVLLF